MGEYPPRSVQFEHLSSCRLTSSSGGAASAAYTTITSKVRVTGGCVTTLGPTDLRDGNLELVGSVFVLAGLHCW